MNETQEKMLVERGVIVLPEDIDHQTYQDVLALLLLAETEWDDKPIRMFCAGMGGSAPDAIAIVDLVQAHGNVIGMLPGEAQSSHVTIWAGCRERYIYPHGTIGIHRLQWSSINTRQDAQSLQQRQMELFSGERTIVKILSNACNVTYGASMWMDTLKNAGSDGVVIFTAADVIRMEMAKPISEYSPKVPVFSAAAGDHTFAMFDNTMFDIIKEDEDN